MFIAITMGNYQYYDSLSAAMLNLANMKLLVVIYRFVTFKLWWRPRFSVTLIKRLLLKQTFYILSFSLFFKIRKLRSYFLEFEIWKCFYFISMSVILVLFFVVQMDCSKAKHLILIRNLLSVYVISHICYLKNFRVKRDMVSCSQYNMEMRHDNPVCFVSSPDACMVLPVKQI